MNTISVGTRLIGPSEPCYVIAEAGSNHNGNFAQALQLIDVAVAARADAVKFQAFKAATMYPKNAGESAYLRQNRSIYDIIEEMELPDEWIPRLAHYCSDRGIEFIVSPFDEDSVDLIEPHVQIYKIASYEMTHAPLVKYIAGKRKPIIMSTGAADLEEVRRAVAWARDAGNDQLILLQCTAKYPAPLGAINVRAISALREAFGEMVGLSDHSRETSLASCAAVALGAVAIEKHFTLSNHLSGPDHQFALEPAELAQLVHDVRATEAALGHGRKERLSEEAELHEFARRSVFCVREVKRGERLTTENIRVLRNGKFGPGIPPESFESIMGCTATRNLHANMPLTPADFA